MKDISFWARQKHDLFERWPVNEQGEKEPAAYLTDVQDSGGMADMTIALLESCGIPCVREYKEEGAMGRIILGFSGYGASLYVPVSRLEEAKEKKYIM